VELRAGTFFSFDNFGNLLTGPPSGDPADRGQRLDAVAAPTESLELSAADIYALHEVVDISFRDAEESLRAYGTARQPSGFDGRNSVTSNTDGGQDSLHDFDDADSADGEVEEAPLMWLSIDELDSDSEDESELGQCRTVSQEALQRREDVLQALFATASFEAELRGRARLIHELSTIPCYGEEPSRRAQYEGELSRRA